MEPQIDLWDFSHRFYGDLRINSFCSESRQVFYTGLPLVAPE
jgi:hypothetical protein